MQRFKGLWVINSQFTQKLFCLPPTLFIRGFFLFLSNSNHLINTCKLFGVVNQPRTSLWLAAALNPARPIEFPRAHEIFELGLQSACRPPTGAPRSHGLSGRAAAARRLRRAHRGQPPAAARPPHRPLLLAAAHIQLKVRGLTFRVLGCVYNVFRLPTSCHGPLCPAA